MKRRTALKIEAALFAGLGALQSIAYYYASSLQEQIFYGATAIVSFIIFWSRWEKLKE